MLWSVPELGLGIGDPGALEPLMNAMQFSQLSNSSAVQSSLALLEVLRLPACRGTEQAGLTGSNLPGCIRTIPLSTTVF